MLAKAPTTDDGYVGVFFWTFYFCALMCMLRGAYYFWISWQLPDFDRGLPTLNDMEKYRADATAHFAIHGENDDDAENYFKSVVLSYYIEGASVTPSVKTHARGCWPRNQTARTPLTFATSQNIAVAVEADKGLGNTQLAARTSAFQFRDMRPKAASEIDDLNHTSSLPGHSKETRTQHIYRRVGAVANSTKRSTDAEITVILNNKKPVAESTTGFYLYGGEIGIRTLGTGEGTTDFESVPFGHSGISPTARIITASARKAKPFR